MLFLRDIQVDIQMRCRDCGHQGTLARPHLERRFGPNYPVLSIAPHYRCSRCNSKDVESRPAPDVAASPAVAAQQQSQDAALDALHGLLQAVRGDPPPDVVHDLMADDLLDTMVEEPTADDDARERALAALRDGDPPPAGNDTDHGDAEDDGDDAFLELLAKLRPLSIAEDEEPEPPAPAPVSGMTDDGVTADASLHETLAALRALASTGESEDDEDGEDAARRHADDEEAFDARDDGAWNAAESAPDDPDDIPEEEIVAFAIRDRDAEAEPDAADLAGEDRGDEDDEEESEDEEDEEAERFPLRRPSSAPEPGSLDESLAALRALVEKAAADEPAPASERKASAKPAKGDKTSSDNTGSDITDGAPRPPLKTAQERSLEETLAQLRGMLTHDADDEEEPVVKPRRR